jgi:hypothetical protein
MLEHVNVPKKNMQEARLGERTQRAWPCRRRRRRVWRAATLTTDLDVHKSGTLHVLDDPGKSPRAVVVVVVVVVG